MTKLADKINQYFELMEDIRTSLFRVLPVSDRYMCVVSFSTSMQALQCKLVNKVSLMEAHLLEGLTGQELLAYGQYMKAAEDWAAGNMQSDYPFAQDADVYAEYRALTTSDEPAHDEDDDEDLDEQEMDNLRTSILCADKATLMQMFADEGLGTKGTAADMDVGQLQDVLCEHYGLNSDVDSHVVDVVGELVKRFERLPNHKALKEADLLTKEEMISLAGVWGLEKTAHEPAMRSLIKGYILRRT